MLWTWQIYDVFRKDGYRAQSTERNGTCQSVYELNVEIPLQFAKEFLLRSFVFWGKECISSFFYYWNKIPDKQLSSLLFIVD